MTVTAYIPIFENGHPVADLTVHINPVSRTVFFEDKSGRRHPCSDTRARDILDDIREYDRDKWRELQRHNMERAK